MDASQTRAVWSSLAVRIRRPSGLNATDQTVSSCGSGAETGVEYSHTRAMNSAPPVAIRAPSGLNAPATATSVCRIGGQNMTSLLSSSHAIELRPSTVRRPCRRG